MEIKSQSFLSLSYLKAGISVALLFSMLTLNQCTEDKSPITSFSTGGHTVYHLQPAKIKKSGKPAIVTASFNGSVQCFKTNGKLIWELNLHENFPFDLAVADIDDDGLDETFVATAGGYLDAIDDDGSLLWSYKREAPLYQVCPVKTRSGDWVILTGGVEEEVYSISEKGMLIQSFKAGDVVRHIRKGDILGDGMEYVAVATASTGLFGKLSLMLIDPDSLKQVWYKTNLGSTAHNSGRRFFSMTIFDLNKDNCQDIVLSGSWGGNGEIFGFDHSGEQILVSSDPMVPRLSYRMNLIDRINYNNSTEENIFGLFANYLIVYNNEGKITKVLKSRYDFSNGSFDPETNTYYIGSSPSGGDGIYALHLDRDGWEKAFEELTPVGKLAEIEKNLEILKSQVSDFRRPVYQKPPSTVTFTSGRPEKGVYDNLRFESLLRVSEIYGDRSELWCRDIDTRLPYDKSSDEIVRMAIEKEKNGDDFIVVGGHGSAFYMSPSTLQKLIIAAPTHLKGFLFSEMSKVDSDMKDVVTKLLLPFAEKCSESGKNIILHNKFIFWSGACYVDFWREVLLNPKFSDVFIPSLEESNCRTQELSLPGRVGLWLTGSFDKWGGRAISDDACFDRMWEWSSQQVLSHHIRHLTFLASMGADNFSLNISGTGSEKLSPLYEMIDKGVIAIPERDELLSVSDLCLGMRDPSKNYLVHGINGHQYNYNENTDRSPLVFDKLDCYWGAAPMADHDFSSYGYGCKRRMLNFLPVNPYGLITIVPDDADLSGSLQIKEKISTDGQYFYDPTGKRYDPVEYKPVVLEKLIQSASRLPVLVKGQVAWSVVRLDPQHIRITLIDPGYIDPCERDAEIVLQHLNGIECTDILSGEKIDIQNNKISLKIPAGTLRVVDIKVKDGYLLESEAKDIARMILHDNAASIYGL